MRSNASGKTIRRKPRLLIVEDDPDLRVLVQFAAKRADVFSTVCAVEDGDAALDLIWASFTNAGNDSPPDLVFTDYNMPKRNGLELAQELRRHDRTRSIPVALFTAEMFDPAPPIAEAAGCQAIYRKPLNFRDLLRIMKALPRLCLANREILCDTSSSFTESPPGRAEGPREAMARGAA
jgi:CheY-like chemotaxis protein